ncbi:hypothetical protein PHMEG_0005284 [Phytophthora megakarya]|uniref:Uncharacterized protein n=1 Tax=Phytophthora megakarya TaxID=4795 RepID=A0A225WRP1_9STRA|nr:hypothetical protein PHMEG_0005284 [Phytophthora megakarya]
MRAICNAVYENFNRIGQPDSRSSAMVLRKVGLTEVDECQSVHVFNVADTREQNNKIDHILNNIFYNEGKRNSEDDDQEGLGELEEVTQSVGTKKDRKVREKRPSDRSETRLVALRQRLWDDPEMARDIDQLIALGQVNVRLSNNTGLLVTTGSETKSQFNPRRQQVETHGLLVNAWIDDCFDQFRSCLVHQDIKAAGDVNISSYFNNKSYARVAHRMTNQRVEAATKSPLGRKPEIRYKGPQHNTKSNHRPPSMPVSAAVLTAYLSEKKDAPGMVIFATTTIEDISCQEDQQRRCEFTLRARGQLLSLYHEVTTFNQMILFGQYDITPPRASAASVVKKDVQVYRIDQANQSAYSELLRRSSPSLPDSIRHVRGETSSDPRLNKALSVPDHLPCWRSYQYKEEWPAIVTNGVKPTWRNSFPTQMKPPQNHGSAVRAQNAVIKSLHKGQDDNRYLILDMGLLSKLDGVTCSPVGAVPKSEADLAVDTRVIHDLSCPKGTSMNDQVQDEPTINVKYDGTAVLAK